MSLAKVSTKSKLVGNVPTVPETLLKNRKKRLNAVREHKLSLIKSNIHKGIRRDQIFKRAEKYAKEYRDMEKETMRLKRQARQNGNYYVEGEPKFVFVLRIAGINGLHPKPRKILQLLRLRQINNGIFIRMNKATKQMLRLVEPYVTWGEVNLKSVKELIYKRGFANVKNCRIPISTNKIIEENLGVYNIICIEDLVKEIYTVGPYFKEVSNFLWYFKLNSPNGGWTKKRKHFVEGGDFGNREHHINELLRKMV
ncbi:hypothetical protein A3Q56_03565 [Intoshia linei]|uniref:Large ribosomal subunit protein uL30 n=1 Tax=Intoshia linei TaxID=1819745 RepID=A0A177B4W0_9BILA|nr:hypothetical protein A3Q56_03565 [Intoshia linei]